MGHYERSKSTSLTLRDTPLVLKGEHLKKVRVWEWQCSVLTMNPPIAHFTRNYPGRKLTNKQINRLKTITKSWLCLRFRCLCIQDSNLCPRTELAGWLRL